MKYHSIVKCPYCMSNNHFYSKIVYEEINTINQQKLFNYSTIINCRFCHKLLKFTKKYIVMNEKNNKNNKKMKLKEPKIKSGYVKSEDIGTKNGADGILICTGEGAMTQGRYGDRLELPVKIGEEDKIWSVSPMNQKLLMGILGNDTALWVDKEIKVFLSPSATARSGFYIGVKE